MEVIQIFRRNNEPELLRITSHAPLPVGLETQINTQFRTTLYIREEYGFLISSRHAFRTIARKSVCIS